LDRPLQIMAWYFPSQTQKRQIVTSMPGFSVASTTAGFLLLK